jgi:hypothetical protein
VLCEVEVSGVVQFRDHIWNQQAIEPTQRPRDNQKEAVKIVEPDVQSQFAVLTSVSLEICEPHMGWAFRACLMEQKDCWN